MKYPRTLHLPWSQSVSRDDRIIENLDILYSTPCIVTEKMDGENFSLFSDRCHARSETSISHPSQTFVRQLWGNIKSNIPKSFQIVGEYLYAKHSIEYSLPQEKLFQVIMIQNYLFDKL